MNALENRFFDDFSTPAKEALLPHLKVETFPSGIYLFHEGDHADGVYLLVEGAVEILKTAGSREQLLAVFHPGDFLGEAALLDGNGRSTCARACGEVIAVKVPTQPLMEVLAQEPVSLTMNLFQQVLIYFRRTNDLFVREVVHKEKLSLVGEMAASLMHDLRNPIAAIRLASDLLTMLHQDEESVRVCDSIRTQCDRVVAMASDLLDVSKGDVKIHPRRSTTTALLEQFQVFNEEYLRQAPVQVTFNSQPAAIEVDSMRVLRLLQNLVTNAVEATAAVPEGRVEVGAWVSETLFHLTVQDNGPGLPGAVIERVFEPFATVGKKGGTGLGMAIVKNVVLAHHGTITFKTARNQGTTFLIKLPQFAAAPHDHSSKTEAPVTPKIVTVDPAPTALAAG